MLRFLRGSVCNQLFQGSGDGSKDKRLCLIYHVQHRHQNSKEREITSISDVVSVATSTVTASKLIQKRFAELPPQNTLTITWSVSPEC